MSTTRRLVLTSLTLLLVTALCAPAAQAAGKKSASITAPSVSARTIDAGQSVTVKARTSASLKGKKVVLQLKKGSSWQTIGSAKVTKKRSVTITSKLSAAGRSQALRLHAPGSSKRKAATRSAGSVTVYGWQSVRTLTATAQQRGSASCTGGCTGFSWRSDNIAGTTYPTLYRMQLSTRGPSTAEFNVDYRCKSFSSDYGLTSSTPTGASATFALGTDSVQNDLGIVEVGGVKKAVVDISGVYRITLRTAFQRQPSGSTSSYSGWGEPKVLCAF